MPTTTWERFGVAHIGVYKTNSPVACVICQTPTSFGVRFIAGHDTVPLCGTCRGTA